MSTKMYKLQCITHQVGYISGVRRERRIILTERYQAGFGLRAGVNSRPHIGENLIRCTRRHLFGDSHVPSPAGPDQ